MVGWSLLAAAGWLVDDDWLADAAGWLLLVELEGDIEASPCTPSADRVCESRLPEPEMPCACWKLCNAA